GGRRPVAGREAQGRNPPPPALTSQAENWRTLAPTFFAAIPRWLGTTRCGAARPRRRAARAAGAGRGAVPDAPAAGGPEGGPLRGRPGGGGPGRRPRAGRRG